MQLTQETCGKRATFTCPYHAWTFGNDGELRAAPDMDRFYVDKKDCGLPKVSVDVCAGLLFVNLDPAPKQGLREYLGPMADKLDRRVRKHKERLRDHHAIEAQKHGYAPA